MDKNNIRYLSVIGPSISEWIKPLAELRIRIFHDWPYIYEGSYEYEQKYLSRYSQASHSFIVMAFDKDKLIGASSCIWLPEESDQEITKAFTDNGCNPSKTVYFGESLLLTEYRGLGIGSEFMKARENFAKNKCNADQVGFCSVIRDPSHILKPPDYKPLDAFWSAKGFSKQANMFCKMSWQDRGDNSETEKLLQFWMKTL